MIGREYERISNKKNDLANKLVAKFKELDAVVMQDEQLNKWKIKNGRKIQHSILGRVKARLFNLENVHILNKYIPTTKMCTHCGSIVELSIRERTFKCPCGIEEDRDIHAANNMIWFYKNNIGVGRTDFKPVELMNLVYKALKQEDAMSLA